ncbi:VOC family protein [Sphingobium cloacae]|uniref:Glyoxalase n=1 Tax=Sphingobium cloacae TaxID=120107 RepID=A0A1E1F1P3_9SPHN|nr:VOC family protein [Sphingobium cloacae]BAV64437.1 glyoxalase [Sphingobium cloacae]
MFTPKIRRIAHLVLYVKDPEASAAWYKDVLGMEIVARVNGGPYVGGVFLTFGVHDHDIALFPTTEDAPKGKEIEHVALELDSEQSLEDLRRVYARFLEKNVRVHEILDHGVSVGIYFFDPDGHMLEVVAQVVDPEGGKAIEELAQNEGQADPIELAPLYD